MVTYYFFKGEAPQVRGQSMKLAFISRETIRGISTKGGDGWKDLSGYGPGKFYNNEEEMNKCIAMNEDDFDDAIMASVMGLGFVPVKKEVEVTLPDNSTALVKYEAKLKFVAVKPEAVMQSGE